MTGTIIRFPSKRIYRRRVGLERRWDRCLRYIEAQIQATGALPSLADIASALSLPSTAGAARVVRQLVAQGRLDWPNAGTAA